MYFSNLISVVLITSKTSPMNTDCNSQYSDSKSANNLKSDAADRYMDY